MGMAWKCSGCYPWETDRYPGGVETVKINIMLRILSAKWHVYAGLAILNPSAKRQVTQYAQSTSDLFKLMLAGNKTEMTRRIFEARRSVFGWKDEEYPDNDSDARKPILMSDTLLDQFHLAARKVVPDQVNSKTAPAARPPNSHLSLLAIVDCWHHLGINPYEHLQVAATPVFRIWIGVCEYLFRSPDRIHTAINAATNDASFRSDDTEFVVAARGWAETVQFGNFEHYEWRFKDTAEFFQSRFEEANKVGTEMLKLLT